jgi:dCTP deaminase
MIEIDPYDEHFLEPATYDLRVGDHAAVTTAPSPINLREEKLLTIEPGAMAILESLEELKLSDRVAARIGPKTTLLRRGIMVATGPQVDPGFHGRLIVNLTNLSPRSFALRYQDPFLSMEFHGLSEAPERPYSGEYQGRTGLTPEELELLFAYQGPTLAEIYRGFATMRDHIREIARISPEFVQMRETMETLPRLLRQTIGEPTAPIAPPVTVHVDTFGLEAYEAMRPIPVVIIAGESQYVASFFAANIHASGDTDQEALDNLRSLILDTFETLEELPDASLSEEVRRQRTTIFEHVRRRT